MRFIQFVGRLVASATMTNWSVPSCLHPKLSSSSVVKLTVVSCLTFVKFIFRSCERRKTSPPQIEAWSLWALVLMMSISWRMRRNYIQEATNSLEYSKIDPKITYFQWKFCLWIITKHGHCVPVVIFSLLPHTFQLFFPLCLYFPSYNGGSLLRWCQDQDYIKGLSRFVEFIVRLTMPG